MIKKTTASYFDGVSSKPHQIELFLDEKKNCFYFEVPHQGWVNWSLKEIDFNYKTTSVVLQIKKNPAQNIHFQDNKFKQDLTVFISETKQVGWYQRFLSVGFKIHGIIALGLLLLIVLGYFYAIPWLGEKAVAIIPESFDNQIGNTVYTQSMDSSEVDYEKTKKLNQFAKLLTLENKKKLNFTVVKSDEVNAFALPDGNIVVYTGIIDKMKSYPELAGLIGHEVAHVNHRHSMKLLCRDLSGYFFVSTVLGDVNGVMAIVGEHANSLRSLSFSRGFETQADEEGLKILLANQINPKGMSDLFSRLQNVEKEIGLSVPEFLSSHPITDERIKHINRLIPKEKSIHRENDTLKEIFLQLKK